MQAMCVSNPTIVVSMMTVFGNGIGVGRVGYGGMHRPHFKCIFLQVGTLARGLCPGAKHIPSTHQTACKAVKNTLHVCLGGVLVVCKHPKRTSGGDLVQNTP